MIASLSQFPPQDQNYSMLLRLCLENYFVLGATSKKCSPGAWSGFQDNEVYYGILHRVLAKIMFFLESAHCCLLHAPGAPVRDRATWYYEQAVCILLVSVLPAMLSRKIYFHCFFKVTSVSLLTLCFLGGQCRYCLGHHLPIWLTCGVPVICYPMNLATVALWVLIS